jgi:tetratricopeptide (TPR) repeat protein
MYCAPDDIPLQMFVKGRGEVPQPLQGMLDPDDEPGQNNLQDRLRRHSLVATRRTEGVLMTVHRLVQEVANHGFEQEEEWVGCCLRIADEACNSQFGSREDFDAFTLALPHLLEIARHAEGLFSEKEQQAAVALIYNYAGYGMYEQGEYAQALEWHHKALAVSEKVLGEGHPKTAVSYNNIAAVYEDQGEYAKALGWHHKALAIREKALGEGHPHTATTYNNIAEVHHAQGEYAKALEWHLKALAVREKVLGEGHPDTARSYNNIAAVYADQGEYAKARDLFCRAAIIMQRCGLADHPNKKIIFAAMQSSFKEAGGREEDFKAWFTDRIETYPEWCQAITLPEQ